MEKIQPSFDYSTLDMIIQDTVLAARDNIRQKIRNIEQDVLTVGAELLSVRAMLPHGQWGNWLNAEFQWSESQARNFMNIAEQFGGKSAIIADLNLSTTVLGMLAAPSVPDEAREKAIEAAQNGERVTVVKAKEMIAAAKPAAVPNPYAKEHEQIRINCRRERAEWAAGSAAPAPAPVAPAHAPQHPAYKYNPDTDGGCHDSSCPGGRCPEWGGCERASILAARAGAGAAAPAPAAPAPPAPRPSERLCSHCGMVPAISEGLCHSCYDREEKRRTAVSLQRLQKMAHRLEQIAAERLRNFHETFVLVSMDDDEIELLANLWMQSWLLEEDAL